MNKQKIKSVIGKRSRIRAQVITALNDNKYTMRSLGGIAKEINITEDELKAIISKDSVLSAEIKTMPFRSKDGKTLVMSKDRFFKEAPFKYKFIDFFSSKLPGIKDE